MLPSTSNRAINTPNALFKIYSSNKQIVIIQNVFWRVGKFHWKVYHNFHSTKAVPSTKAEIHLLFPSLLKHFQKHHVGRDSARDWIGFAANWLEENNVQTLNLRGVAQLSNGVVDIFRADGLGIG